MRNFVFFGLAVAFFMITYLFLSLLVSLRESLKQISRGVQGMANGDLSQEIVIHSQDELFDVAHSFNEVHHVLNHFIRAQNKMAEDHNVYGLISRAIPVQEFRGVYAEMAKNVNDMVQAHVAVKMKAMDLMESYAKGDFSQSMPVLPAEKLRVTNTCNQVRDELQASAKTAYYNQQIKIALDSSSTNLMIGDNQGVVMYANPAVLKLLLSYQTELRQHITGFDASKVVGQSFDQFHVNPSHQRNMLSRLTEVYRTQIEVGNLTFALAASPIVSQQGEYLGTVIEWVDRTKEIHVQREVATVVSAALNGDYSHRVQESGKEGFFKVLSQQMNGLLSNTESALKEIGVVMNGLAAGDLTIRMSANYQGLLDTIKQDTNRSIGQIASIIDGIRAATQEITTASQEIATGNSDLSRRTEEQASSLEETASSMEEITATVKQNADNAKQANQMATSASDVAIQGGASGVTSH
jgi:methyl-accepting chemotaxis protein